MAHNVHATDSELERLARRGNAIAHCPGSNAALGSGIFPFRRPSRGRCDVRARHRRRRRHRVRHAEGSAAGVPDAARGAGSVMLDPARMLYLATRAGAEALGLDDEIGDFQPGKAADLVYLRPPPDSVARRRSFDMRTTRRQALAALFTLAGSGERVARCGSKGSACIRAGTPVTIAET